MYASIRRYEGVTDPDLAARRVREGFVPLIRGLDGFVAYFWMDAGDGVMFSTSIFESQTAAEESNRMAAGWAKMNLADVLPSPQVAIGPVVAEAVAARNDRWSEAERHEAPRH